MTIDSFFNTQLDPILLLVLHIGIVITVAFLLNVVIQHTIDKAIAKAEASVNIWDNVFFISIKRPLNLSFYVTSFYYSAQIASKKLSFPLNDKMPEIFTILCIAIVAFFLLRLTSQFEKSYIENKNALNETIDRGVLDAITKLIKLAIYLVVSITILQYVGFSLSGLLAFGGMGGIAVGFAAKDFLASFFGGLRVLYLDHPFMVGDWIRSPDLDLEGTVERIDWRQTIIRKFNSNYLSVPNSVFSNICIENVSRMTNRRIYEYVGIRYSDAAKMALITDDIRQMLSNDQDIDQSKTIIVNFDKFSPSSLDLYIYCFCKTINWVAYTNIKERILLNVIQVIESHDAECAFPTSTIHLMHDEQKS
jgi:MscS family membrane protein